MSQFSIFHWLIVIGTGYFLWRLFARGGSVAMHCSTCGTNGATRSVVRGHLAIEIILWLCFIVPGLIYSVWRTTTRHRTCAACGSANVIPLDSPAAQSPTLDLETRPCPFCAEIIKRAAKFCRHCRQNIPV